MPYECVERTHVGCRRKLNEDAVLSAPDQRLWAVADGMGGHEAGDVASALVVEHLASCDQPDLLDRVSAVGRVLQDANHSLRNMGGERTIGATVVVLAADDQGFACLWAGDSRAYCLRRGQLRQLTRDHSLVQELVDVGALSPDEAAGHPNANVIRRAVGAADRLDLDLINGEVAEGDVFLLASDGLTRLVQDSELAELLAADDLEDAAERMLQTTLDRGAPDNVSLVLVRRIASSD